MNGNHVTLADYSGHFAALGDPTQNAGAFARKDVVDQLNSALEMRKSLSTGSNPALGFADGSALIPQSLETTLQVVSYEMKELKLWNSIPKAPAYAMFEEFDRLESYGSNDNGWMEEGGLPAEDDSVYTRDVQRVKFLGTVRSVTHVMQLVRTISAVDPIIEQEDRNGMVHLLRQLETALFEGDDRINGLAIQGIFQQIEQYAPQNVIDMAGQPITDKTLMDIDNMSADVYGTLDTMYMSNRVKNNLSQILMNADQKRLAVTEQGQNVTLGMTTQSFVGNNSSIGLNSHQFIREGQQPPTTAKLTAPAAPATLTATPRVTAPGEVSRHLVGATFTYEVHAVNQYGEGVGIQSAAVALAANDAMEVVWPQVAGAQFYRLYRRTNGGKMLKVCDVARGGLATVTYVDLNQNIEGTSKAYALMTGPNAIRWKQLAPPMKLPLATLDTRTRWAILIYGTLMMYQPQKQFVLKNIGDGGITHDVDYDRPLN